MQKADSAVSVAMGVSLLCLVAALFSFWARTDGKTVGSLITGFYATGAVLSLTAWIACWDRNALGISANLKRSSRRLALGYLALPAAFALLAIFLVASSGGTGHD